MKRTPRSSSREATSKSPAASGAIQAEGSLRDGLGAGTKAAEATTLPSLSKQDRQSPDDLPPRASSERSAKTSLWAFDPLVLLRQPERCVAPTAWVGHIPFAYWIARAARPQLYVELGTHAGNSYCAVCQSVLEAQLATNCYAVDTWQGDEQAGHYGHEVLADLRRHHDPRYGSFSTLLQSTFDDALAFFGDHTVDLLHIDGCHTYEAVKHDFESWLPKLTPNAVVMFHDTVVRHGSFGVWRLWDELAETYPSFNFPHSHGLGVIALGEVPPALAPLFDATAPQIAEIQRLFGLVGSQLRERAESGLSVARLEKETLNARAEADAASQHSAALSARLIEADANTKALADNQGIFLGRINDLGGAILSAQSRIEHWGEAFERRAQEQLSYEADARAVTSLLRAESQEISSRLDEKLEKVANDHRMELSAARADAETSRRQVDDLVLDAMVAWTRYAGLLQYVDDLTGKPPRPDAGALSQVLEEGKLEARRITGSLVNARNLPLGERNPIGAAGPAIRRHARRRVNFRRVAIGDTSLRPVFTLICASDDAAVDFDGLLESVHATAAGRSIEVFIQLGEGVDEEGFETGSSDARLVAEIDRIILDRARGRRIAIVSLEGTLHDGWIEGLESSLEGNGLSAAASGVVLTGPDEVGWSGASSSDGAGWQLADREVGRDDYRVASTSRLDGVVPGLVAFAPDLYREVGGLRTEYTSLAAALLEVSVRIADAGLEIYRAPRALLTLLGGAEEALRSTAAFDIASVDAPRPFRRTRPRVLVIDALTPTPDQDAGSIDAFWGMQILRSLDYEVTFLPMYNTSHAGQYTESLRQNGIYCPVSPALTTVHEFVERHGKEYDLVVLYRVTVAHSLIGHCRHFAPNARIVFHTVDIHFLREERVAAREGSPELRAQAEATKLEELRCIAAADAAIVVSRTECDLIADLVPDASIFLVPVMHPAPGRLAPRQGRNGVMFVGGFGHEPNIDAVKFMVGEVWPRLRKRMPDLTIEIIGPRAPPDIVALHDPSQGIHVVGFVEDLVPHYARALVNVAPLRVGAGIKGKVLAAMMVGLPTVASTIAAEGMGLTDGRDIIIADDPDEIAEAVLNLCEDDQLWYAISDSGIDFSMSEFSVNAQVPRWRRILQSLALPT